MRAAYEVRIPFEAAALAFKSTVDLPLQRRSNFFADLRSEFRKQVQVHILEAGIPTPYESREPPRLTKSAKIKPLSPIRKMTGWKNEIAVEIDAKFSVGYGADDYSLQALNYLERSACELPSLRPFLEIPDFTLGNFTFEAPNEDCDFNVVCGDGIELTGIAFEASRKKRFSYFALLGVRVDPERLRTLFKSEHCGHPSGSLDEVRIGTLHYPVTYVCRHCGHLLICKCFAGTYDVRSDLLRHLPYGNSEKPLASAVEDTLSRDGICSLCTGRVPRHIYGHSMYYSTFLQRYLPYQTLFARRRFGRDVYEGEPEYKELENETRRAFGFMQIGQEWLNETFLFKIVSVLAAPEEVVHHYRGKELEGLEIDVWVPSLRLGVEYQGEQHYRAMEHWGGEAGLSRRLANDKRKKALCQKLGYKLIEFHYTEPISEDTVRKRLANYLKATPQLPQRDA